MAISDKYLPGNLNQAEMDTVKGIPMEIFNKLSSEEQNQLLGNLNRAELNQLRGSKSGTGMSSESAGNFAEIKSLIGRLMAAGASRAEIMAAVQNLTRGNLNPSEIGELIAAGASRNEISGADVGGRIAAGVPMNRFNQGGIVSLRHLTRPLGI